jgi:hypothetical protein
VVIGISFADRMQGRGDDLGRGVGKSSSRKFKSLLRAPQGVKAISIGWARIGARLLSSARNDAVAGAHILKLDKHRPSSRIPAALRDRRQHGGQSHPALVTIRTLGSLKQEEIP